ncbi:hypothetical protein [Micromonospora sonchi]|uniref:hypothetical protein n=1 Tax=Micromonospora sonchi TaxID=1763543 RepID=UPI001E5AE6AF|nr:hypothetical protein [Micromonospora sonchi]
MSVDAARYRAAYDRPGPRVGWYWEAQVLDDIFLRLRQARPRLAAPTAGPAPISVRVSR